MVLTQRGKGFAFKTNCTEKSLGWKKNCDEKKLWAGKIFGTGKSLGRKKLWGKMFVYDFSHLMYLFSLYII